MANVQYYDVILKPVVTEKSMNAMTDKKYTFLVHPDANKTMIKEAVEENVPGNKGRERKHHEVLFSQRQKVVLTLAIRN